MFVSFLWHNACLCHLVIHTTELVKCFESYIICGCEFKVNNDVINQTLLLYYRNIITSLLICYFHVFKNSLIQGIIGCYGMKGNKWDYIMIIIIIHFISIQTLTFF